MFWRVCCRRCRRRIGAFCTGWLLALFLGGLSCGGSLLVLVVVKRLLPVHCWTTDFCLRVLPRSLRLVPMSMVGLINSLLASCAGCGRACYIWFLGCPGMIRPKSIVSYGSHRRRKLACPCLCQRVVLRCLLSSTILMIEDGLFGRNNLFVDNNINWERSGRFIGQIY